ncbi:MAG TPA: glycosyltransferase, partial [Acidiphilium sp.]
SRLASQKGIDLIIESLPVFDELKAQLVVLGAGDPAIERALRTAVTLRPGRVAASIGFEEALAHLIQGGADAILVPSRFEPCGLTQLSAQRYGAIPVVSRVGGLADTVIDANEAGINTGVATGVQFAPVTAAGLVTALRRAAALHENRTMWRRMQRNAMALDVSWTQPARHYARLYRDLAR